MLAEPDKSESWEPQESYQFKETQNMLTRMSPKVYHALLELYTVLLHKNVTSVDIHTSEVRSMYTSGVKSKEKETKKKER